MKDHAAEASERGICEVGVGLNQGLGVAASFFDDGRVAMQIGNSQRWEAVLTCSKKIAGATELKVNLGQLEAVAGLDEGVEPLLCFVAGWRGEDADVAWVCTAADAAAELMQLRQAKPLATFNRHQRGIGYIHSHFDDAGGHEHLRAATAKGLHR